MKILEFLFWKIALTELLLAAMSPSVGMRKFKPPAFWDFLQSLSLRRADLDGILFVRTLARDGSSPEEFVASDWVSESEKTKRLYILR